MTFTVLEHHMGERGRRSAALLSVVASTVIDGRTPAPTDLTDEQRQIWERVVVNEAADTFKTAALQQLLKEYCRHCTSALKLARMHGHSGRKSCSGHV